MLKRVAAAAFTAGLSRSRRALTCSRSYCASSSAVDSLIIRSLRDHYVDASKLHPPPKLRPPQPFTVVKGTIDSDGPALKRTYKNEEISLYVTRLTNMGAEEEDVVNQLLLHVEVWKPGQEKAFHFLCGLYPDAMGIHSISMRPRLETSLFEASPNTYDGPNYDKMNEKMKDALHYFLEEREINESLFPFLQAWLYVKEHRIIMRWFKVLAEAIGEPKAATDSK